MAIQLVGYKTYTGTSASALTISLTDLTSVLDTQPSTNDIVVVYAGVCGLLDYDITVGTGDYTELADLYSNDSNDAGLSVSYKIMGGTPDTSVDVSHTSASTGHGQAGAIFVFRGVDTTTPIDVTTTTATGDSNGQPDPPRITPVTSGAVIVAGGCGAAYTQANFTSSDLSNFITNSIAASQDAAIGAGTYDWTSGAFNAAKFGGGSTASTSSWVAASIALRPAASSGYTLTAAAGGFTVNGTATTLKAARKIPAGVGSYTLTGTAATFRKGYTLAAGVGSYTLNGTAAALKTTRSLTASPGAYSLTGTAAGLKSARTIVAESGSYSFSGTDAALRSGRTLTASPGAFTFTGTDAVLTYTPASVAYTLTADPGAFTLSGTNAALKADRTIVASSGSYALTGTDANLQAGRLLTAGSGTYALTGTDAALKADYVLTAEPGAFTLSGTAASLTYSAVETQPVVKGGKRGWARFYRKYYRELLRKEPPLPPAETVSEPIVLPIPEAPTVEEPSLELVALSDRIERLQAELDATVARMAADARQKAQEQVLGEMIAQAQLELQAAFEREQWLMRLQEEDEIMLLAA